jgi:putative mRNA 3-end processing factor
LERLNALYERHGVDLGPLEPATTSATKQDFAGQIVIAPPSATQDRWSRRFPDPVLAFASGWMQVRARARQRGVELPLVISDHADWDELTATVDELRPGELWITHGREEALGRWAELHGVPARALALVGYEEEDND